MHKNCCPVLWKNYVGLSRKLLYMQPEAESPREQSFAYGEFNSSVLRADP